MIRLCFERQPGLPSIDKENDFIEWFEANFPKTPYTYAGYKVCDLGEMWHNQNVLWNVIVADDLELLTNIERNRWVRNGYIVHAYSGNYGHGEYKIDNRAFRQTAGNPA